MAGIICPWEILRNPLPSQPVTIQVQNQQRINNQNSLLQVNNNQVNPQLPQQISYADRVRGEQPKQIDVESLLSPVMVGGIPTVTLSRTIVEKGKKYCEFSLIGRLDFNKVSLKRLHIIATELWMPSGDWKLTPLGKGFFMFRLESKDDFIRIWSQAWKIRDQVLHFTKWTQDFDAEKQRTSNALLWVQFPRLGQQYWDYEALMTIGKGLGTPIGVDKKTIAREFGYFANVLIDIDLSQPVPKIVNVQEEEGKLFAQEIYIPKMPSFCSHCKSVGHNIYGCRRLMRAIQEPSDNGRRTRNGVGVQNGSTNRGNTSNAGNLVRDNGGVVVQVVPAMQLESTEQNVRQQDLRNSTEVANVNTDSVHPQINARSNVNSDIVPAAGVVPTVMVVVDDQTVVEQLPPIEERQEDIASNVSGNGMDGNQGGQVQQHGEVTNTENIGHNEQENINRDDINVQRNSAAEEQEDSTSQSNQQEGTLQTAPLDTFGQLNGDANDSERGNDSGGYELVCDGYQGNVNPDPDPLPGLALVLPNNTLAVSNSFHLLNESDIVPQSLTGIVNQVNMVNQRMADCLNGNSGNHNNNSQISSRGRQSRGRGRGRSWSTSAQSRDDVQASSLGPRRSQRGITTSNCLDL